MKQNLKRKSKQIECYEKQCTKVNETKRKLKSLDTTKNNKMKNTNNLAKILNYQKRKKKELNDRASFIRRERKRK